MIQHYHYSLSPGCKLCITKNPGMSDVVKSLMGVPGGKMTAADISTQTNLSSNVLAGYLQKLKQKGIVDNSRIGTGERKQWFINPGIKNSLSIFIQSVGVVD